MATCANIGNRSLRNIGKLGAGRDPRPADAEDVFEALKGMYKAWVGSGALGRLADVIPTGDYTAGENQRIFRNSEATGSITLPQLVPAYSTPLPYNQERDSYTNYEQVDGSNRPPRDGAVVVVVNAFEGLTNTYIYDGATRNWQEIDTLTPESEAPRSYADPEGLAACLSIEIAAMFTAEVQGGTIRQARRFESGLSSRYSMPREASAGVYY